MIITYNEHWGPIPVSPPRCGRECRIEDIKVEHGEGDGAPGCLDAMVVEPPMAYTRWVALVRLRASRRPLISAIVRAAASSGKRIAGRT